MIKRKLVYAVRAYRGAHPVIVTRWQAKSAYATAKATRVHKFGDGTRSLVMDNGSSVMLCFMTDAQLAMW